MTENSKVFAIDEQWLELRAHLYRIRLADRRQKRPREDCAVCRDSLAKCRLTTMPCGHQLHTNCYAELESNHWDRRCPICRQNVGPAAPSVSPYSPYSTGSVIRGLRRLNT
jgi:hypothetical protein